MKNLLILFTLLLCCCLTSCDSADNARMGVDSTSMEYQEPLATEGDGSETSIERKLIREGQLHFQTADVSATRSKVADLVTSMGGYLSQENTSNYRDRITYRMTIRVQEMYLDSLIRELSNLAERVEYKNLSARDVTEEYIDIEKRLENKKILEERYLAILDQAKTVQEILNIERELNELRTEIESIEGRLNYLKNQVQYSTLQLEFYSEKNTAGFYGIKISDAFSDGFRIFLEFTVLMVKLWIFIFLAIAFILWLRWRKRRRNS